MSVSGVQDDAQHQQLTGTVQTANGVVSADRGQSAMTPVMTSQLTAFAHGRPTTEVQAPAGGIRWRDSMGLSSTNTTWLAPKHIAFGRNIAKWQ